MKPPPFDYSAPTTVSEAVQLLDSDEDAKVLAGGQSFLPVLNIRLAHPSVLIDLNGLWELDYIRRENDHLAVGAMTRQRTLELDEAVRRDVPVLGEVIPHIGHVTIRNRGTVGGNLAHADPASELPAAMLALGASFTLTGPGGSRTVTAEDFFQTYFTTALEPNEILTEIRVPVPSPRMAYAFEEFALRHGDFAIAAVVALVELEDDGRVRAARLAVAGANPAALRPTEAESLLTGEIPSEAAVGAAAEAVTRAIEPLPDARASADYRREVTRVLTRRALGRAITRAKGGA